MTEPKVVQMRTDCETSQNKIKQRHARERTAERRVNQNTRPSENPQLHSHIAQTQNTIKANELERMKRETMKHSTKFV